MMGRASAVLWIAAVLIAAASGIASAQAPAAPTQALTPVELRFDVSRYVIDGNTLLAPERVEEVVRPYTGRQRDFGDVQRALEALENAYRVRGFSAVQVYLPEQDLEKGEVRLRVVEARIRNVQIQGNRFFSNDNVRASLPSLGAGRTPNSAAVAKNLALVNENATKQTNVTLRAGEKEGEVDAVVDVADEKPSKAFVALDNTGTGATGYYRLGLGYQNWNLNDRDSALVLQYITSPDHVKDVAIYSAAYHLPLYSFGGSMDFVAAYSDVNGGTTSTTAGPLAFTGRGGVLGARYNQHLDRLAGYEHKLVWAVDQRDYRNTCSVGEFGAAGCGSAGASFSLTPISLSYIGTLLGNNTQTTGYVTGSTNVGGGSRGDTDALGQARFGAKARYSVLRMGLNHAHALPGDWQLRARLDLQETNEVLVVPEQFGIGGANSVRGFLERELSNDRGHSGSLEVYTPELATALGWRAWNLRMLAFYDLGRVSRIDPQPGESDRSGIASAGIGVRVTQGKTFSVRLDLATILDAGGTRERGHWRGAFGAAISF